MYVAVKGGERAIANAHALLAKEGRGDPDLPRIDFAAVAGQLGATFDYTHRLFTDRDAGSSARWQKALRYQAPEPTSPPEETPSPSTPRDSSARRQEAPRYRTPVPEMPPEETPSFSTPQGARRPARRACRCRRCRA